MCLLLCIKFKMMTYLSLQHDVIKFICDLQKAEGRWFSGSPFSTTNKTDRNDITEIFLNVALNTTNLNLVQLYAEVVPLV